jgi:1-acyl-sn-glycerol-3-phosphate acyltransferase
MIKSYEMLDQGISVAVFPEGTIPKDKGYQMIPFKEGAFRMAIEKQVPIVPITIPYNWFILPDDGVFIPNRHLMKMIIHEPIETKGMNIDQIQELSDKTYAIIQNELIKQNQIIKK